MKQRDESFFKKKLIASVLMCNLDVGFCSPDCGHSFESPKIRRNLFAQGGAYLCSESPY